MIPTLYKAKLPQELSYPIGAGAISDALAGAPHAESLTVAFCDRPVWSASQFRRLLAGRQPYTVLAAEYEPTKSPGYGGPRSLAERGWYDERWEIRVYPVLREARSLASRLLRERGLAAVVQWLRTSQRAGWGGRPRRLDLVFDPASEALSAKEISAA